MSDAAPPPWVKAAPGLSAAHKFMLQVLWGYGPYAREELWVTIDGDRQPRTPARCWEPCEELAKLTDQPAGTVRKQLRKLAADGWILRGSGSMRTLAWRAPGVFAYGAGGTSAHPLSTGAPGQECSPPVHTGPPSDHEVPPRVTTDAPQTLQEPSIQLSNDLEVEARAFPPPPRHQAAQTSLVTGRPSGLGAMGAGEQLAVYATPADPADDWRRKRAQLLLDAQASRELAAVSFGVLTPAMLEGLDPEQRDAWHQEAAGGEHGTWSRAMGERARKLGMTREALGAAVLPYWERECAEHPPGVKPGQPDRGELWYSKHSAWLRAAALGDQEPESPFAFHPSPELTVVGSMT